MKQKTLKRWKPSRYGEYMRKQYEPSEKKRLVKLKKDLLKLGKFPSGDSKKIIHYNIDFMDIVSKFQDDGYLKYQPATKKEIVRIFNLAICNSGRQQDYSSKWNMTKKGEPVTKNNVVYGGVYGLPIKPAIYWLSAPKSQQVIVDPHTSRHMWVTDAIVKSGIERFTRENNKVIFSCIDKLLNVSKTE